MGSNLGLVFSSVLQSCYINWCLHKLFLHFPIAFSLSLSLQKPIEHFLLSDFSWMRHVATTSPNPEMKAEKRYGQVQEGKRILLPHNMDISHNPILSQTPWPSTGAYTSANPGAHLQALLLNNTCAIFQALEEKRKWGTMQHFQRFLYYPSLLLSKTTNVLKTKMETWAQKLVRMHIFNLICTSRDIVKKHCSV